MAIVKFTPSKINPHGEFADEFYYPPDMRQRMAKERRKANRFDDYDEGFYDKLGVIDNPEEGLYGVGLLLVQLKLAYTELRPHLSSSQRKCSSCTPHVCLQSHCTITFSSV